MRNCTFIKNGTSFVLCTLYFVLCTFLLSCTPKNTPDVPVTPIDTTAHDTIVPSEEVEVSYRPQVHYTVAHNWMNDPNGLCYVDGTWHLYYQYNPNGIECDFGGMSWGHATSSDLMHWTERTPVLYPDEMGAMFSGCSVVDTENKAGFGAGAILAYYTSSGYKQEEKGDRQWICLAISNDGGMTFRKYEHNPIVPSTGLVNFRDPKVVWDAAHNQYVMVIAKGWDQGLEFWRSTNLRDWSFVPYIFKAEPARCNLGQYECPDLFWLPYDDAVNAQSSNRKSSNRQSSEGAWVLVLSTMPGGYIHGSGTMYFIGDLTAEGYFVCDEMENGEWKTGNGQWLDYGADYYAAVSWDNAPDGRKVAIGWMNNWDYAPACPPTEWKSAFALPREYSLRKIDGRTVLCSNPVKELESIAGEWKPLPNPLLGEGTSPFEGNRGELAYELCATVSLTEDDTIRLYNPYGEWYEIRIDSRCRRIISDRSRSGQRHFSPLFAVPAMTAPIFGLADEVELRLIVDQSSVELFSEGGAVCVTNTVYPRSIYNYVSASKAVQNLKYRKLESVWK